MIKNTVYRSLALLTRIALPFSKISVDRYSPPPSQFQQFKKHLFNMQEQSSRKTAAELMARLQSDQEIYKQNLLILEQQLKILNAQNPRVVDLINRRLQIQNEIQDQLAENKAIEGRCLKQIQNIKVFGIAKIAKQVIQISDHIKSSITSLKNIDASDRNTALKDLQIIDQDLHRLFGKYQIQQFDPKGVVFNPHEHESMSHIATTDQNIKNTVAQTLRTGFKIKDRLLRSAYVVIFV